MYHLMKVKKIIRVFFFRLIVWDPEMVKWILINWFNWNNRKWIHLDISRFFICTIKAEARKYMTLSSVVPAKYLSSPVHTYCVCVSWSINRLFYPPYHTVSSVFLWFTPVIFKNHSMLSTFSQLTLVDWCSIYKGAAPQFVIIHQRCLQRSTIVHSARRKFGQDRKHSNASAGNTTASSSEARYSWTTGDVTPAAEKTPLRVPTRPSPTPHLPYKTRTWWNFLTTDRPAAEKTPLRVPTRPSPTPRLPYKTRTWWNFLTTDRPAAEKTPLRVPTRPSPTPHLPYKTRTWWNFLTTDRPAAEKTPLRVPTRPSPTPRLPHKTRTWWNFLTTDRPAAEKTPLRVPTRPSPTPRLPHKTRTWWNFLTTDRPAPEKTPLRVPTRPSPTGNIRWLHFLQ